MTMSDRIERGQALLGDLIQLVRDLDQGRVPFVSRDIAFVYVHFFDEDGDDIGNLCLSDALQALHCDVYLWPDCSTSEDENGEPEGDLDIRDAVRLELHTH
jgi:hypothetical protein